MEGVKAKGKGLPFEEFKIKEKHKRTKKEEEEQNKFSAYWRRPNFSFARHN